jgi:hypothetical protein
MQYQKNPTEVKNLQALDRLLVKRTNLTKEIDLIKKQQLAPLELELKSVLDKIIRINKARNQKLKT